MSEVFTLIGFGVSETELKSNGDRGLLSRDKAGVVRAASVEDGTP